MATEMGEFVVGAYLKECLLCDFVDYNVRRPGGGMAGLAELDVVGLDFKSSTAYLCEVATHLVGLEYGKGYEHSAATVRKKYEVQREYAQSQLRQFTAHHFMFWSPRVPTGYLTKALAEIEGLELIINADYTARVEELRNIARATKRNTGNPFFRALQILERLKVAPNAV